MSSDVIVDLPRKRNSTTYDQFLNRESALIRLIYQNALSNDASQDLRSKLLSVFREDRIHQTANVDNVVEHLKRAIRISQSRTTINAEREQLEQVLLGSTPPFLIVNKTGDIQFMNSTCRSNQRRFYQEYGFRFENQTLIYQHSDLITDLLNEAETRGIALKKINNAPLNDQRHKFGLRLAVFQKPDNKGLYQLLFFDDDKYFTQAMDHLANNHGISKKEKALIEALFEDSDINIVANSLSISVQTVRQHLKNIFAKFGVNSQTALFNVVLNQTLVHGFTAIDQPQSYAYAEGLAKTHVLKLSNGRVVSYLDMGPVDGFPVMYFHSINSSRFELLNLQSLFVEHGIRLICMDRTGYGESTYDPKDSYAEYSHDIRLFMDALELDRVGLLSCSAGSPHALSFAEHYPERVTQVHCTSAVPTPEFVVNARCPSAMNDTLNKFFRIVPALMRPALELALMGQTSKKILNSIGTGNRLDIFTYSELDTQYIKSESEFPYFMTSLTESLRQGPKAWANENVMVNKPWQMNLHKIEPEVMFWHGTKDTLIPLEMVKPFVDSLPNGDLTVLEGETHLLIFRHLEKILPCFHKAI